MKSKLLSLILLLTLFGSAFSQQFKQYFDGADTIFDNSFSSSLRIVIHPDSSNIWQVGMPQKTIFNSAATIPNALLTDTVSFYPTNNSSVFQFKVKPWINWGIMAIQWKQKLDMDQGTDGGKIEFSVDSGSTWQNAFDNPLVYNFYGFEPDNSDTLPNGEYVFSGTDTTWRNIWLCYDMSWLSDSLFVRFTFTSDSIDNNREGWMIDNMLVNLTIIHTVDEKKSEKYLQVYPNPASDRIFIEAQKRQEFHIIEHMSLIDAAGRVVGEWKHIPTKFFIDAGDYANGLYHLKVKTNIKTETVPVIINHH